MSLVTTFFMRALEFLFFAGWVGSAIVIILTTIEDVEETFSHNSQDAH